VGHLQRSTITGHLLRAASGHLVQDCSCCCECACEGVACGYCCATPDSWTVSFTDVVVAECQACSDDASSTSVTGGDLDHKWSATFSLTQDAEESCCWVYIGSSALTAKDYNNTDCSDDSVNETDYMEVRLCRGETTWTLDVYLRDDTLPDVIYVRLYHDEFAADGEICCAELASSNEYVDYHCYEGIGNEAGVAVLGKEGTAILTPCV